jgi:ornithine carbamoyltransferase
MQHGTNVNYTSDPREACAGAHVIITDTWVSMGQETEAQKRLKDFKGYQVDNEVQYILGLLWPGEQ